MKAKDDYSKNPEDWFEKGRHDFVTAKVAFDGGGAMDTIATLLQQAVEKYLKGFLISKKWELKKTHDLEELLEEVIKYDETFAGFFDLGRQLSACYVEDRYPYTAQSVPIKDEVADFIKQCEKLVALCIAKVKNK